MAGVDDLDRVIEQWHLAQGEIERAESKVGGMEEISPYALRVTMIFRPEEGTWKVVHRHADPITTTRPAESVIQQ